MEEKDGMRPPCEKESPPTHPHYLSGGSAPMPPGVYGSRTPDARGRGGEAPFDKSGREGGDSIPGVNACWIPPLTPEGARALEMRAKLITLGELVGKENILRMYGATREDIELMAVMEEELKGTEKDG